MVGRTQGVWEQAVTVTAINKYWNSNTPTVINREAATISALLERIMHGGD